VLNALQGITVVVNHVQIISVGFAIPQQTVRQPQHALVYCAQTTNATFHMQSHVVEPHQFVLLDHVFNVHRTPAVLPPAPHTVLLLEHAVNVIQILNVDKTPTAPQCATHNINAQLKELQ